MGSGFWRKVGHHFCNFMELSFWWFKQTIQSTACLELLWSYACTAGTWDLCFSYRKITREMSEAWSQFCTVGASHHRTIRGIDMYLSLELSYLHPMQMCKARLRIIHGIQPAGSCQRQLLSKTKLEFKSAACWWNATAGQTQTYHVSTIC